MLLVCLQPFALLPPEHHSSSASRDAGCAWPVPDVNTGLVDLNAASMVNPALSRPQDCCGWLLVLLVLRAFGVWVVACVVQQ